MADSVGKSVASQSKQGTAWQGMARHGTARCAICSARLGMAQYSTMIWLDIKEDHMNSCKVAALHLTRKDTVNPVLEQGQACDRMLTRFLFQIMQMLPISCQMKRSCKMRE